MDRVGASPEITQRPQGALSAFRLPRRTNLPTVPDELVGEFDPGRLWDPLHEVELDLYRVVFLGQSDSLREPFYMCVHDDSRYAEGISQHDIRRLSSHAGQFDQRFHCVRDLAVVILDNSFAAGFYVFCLVAIKPGGTNQFFQSLYRDLGKVFSGF